MITTYDVGAGGRGTSRSGLGETDAEGRFELRDVPVGNTVFLVHGDGIDEQTFVLDPELVDDLVLVVSLRLRFQLDPDVAPAATRFEVHDAGGERLKFIAIRTTGDSHTTSWGLGDRTALPTVEVGDEAAEVVFFDGDAEVERKPLYLRRGEITVVR